MELIFPAFMYKSGISPPILLIWTANGDAVRVESTNLRLLQRVVAAERFYGQSNGSFDTALVVK